MLDRIFLFVLYCVDVLQASVVEMTLLRCDFGRRFYVLSFRITCCIPMCIGESTVMY